jgi:hypothetical protein
MPSPRSILSRNLRLLRSDLATLHSGILAFKEKNMAVPQSDNYTVYEQQQSVPGQPIAQAQIVRNNNTGATAETQHYTSPAQLVERMRVLNGK